MTITNHIQRIQELAELVITSVDARRYPEAHGALDDIQVRCLAARAHVESLQQIHATPFVTAGEVPL